MGKALLRTYGCQMNERDSENIAAMFAERGWELTDDEDAADIIVINTCSVREQAEQKAIGKLWHLVSRRRWRGTFLPVIGVYAHQLLPANVDAVSKEKPNWVSQSSV